MSLIDDALAGYIKIETAKASNPRQVQTIQQAQSDRRTSVDSASVNAAQSVSKPGISFAGFDQRILIGTGVVLVAVFAFSMMRK